jgi:tRNA pseudouridine13 synthase
MEIISYLATRMRTQPRTFQFSGTKDRRGVTVQRISAYRMTADALKGVQKSLRGAKIGGIKHEKYPLSLGKLKGNEFVIALRDCHFPGDEGLSFADRMQLAESTVSRATESLRSKGFINYYGLQRFGTFAASTAAVGQKLLKGDIKAAVELILQHLPQKTEDESSQQTSDERNRALAIDIWESTKNSRRALEVMPRRFSAEVAIIKHLGQVRAGKKTNLEDWQGAISSIPRNLRLMYVHAYQSLVWNAVASFRWEKYGDKVVEGDLVIIAKQSTPEANEIDENGELIIHPVENDFDAADSEIERARPLTKEEADSGKFAILDVALPLPGYDICYPANEAGQFYSDFMGSEEGGGLDPHDMRRKWKDISLTGGYRKFVSRPACITGEVKSYFGETEQLVETDLDRLEKEAAGASAAGTTEEMQTASNPPPDVEQKIAVILRLQLGSGQYATMALRELLKAGVKSYQPEFRNDR